MEGKYSREDGVREWCVTEHGIIRGKDGERIGQKRG